MIRRAFAHCLLAVALAVGTLAAQAAEPSLHEVYQAAESGQLAQAQSMMDQVLKAHPNSAKAHFVEAELLVRQGRLAEARTELQKAEVLAPGLPFAQPQAVQSLRSALARAAAPSQALTAAPVPASHGFGGAGWGLALMGAGLAFAALVYLLRSRSQATAAPAPAYGPSSPVPAYAGAYGPGNATAPAPSGGIGSGILGGLATGAAVGAGMVAGQALMHRVFDEPHAGVDPRAGGQGFEPLDDRSGTPPAGYDMGGNDFGVNDAGSWDAPAADSDDWS